MTEPAALPPPLPLESVSSHSDRFRCEPYKVVMFAGACVKRQAVLRQEPKRDGFSRCRGCAHGARVEQQTGGPVEVEVSTPGKRWMDGYYAGLPKPNRVAEPAEVGTAPEIEPAKETIVMPRTSNLSVEERHARKLEKQREWRAKKKLEAAARPNAVDKPTRSAPAHSRAAVVSSNHLQDIVGPVTVPNATVGELIEAHKLVAAMGWELARVVARAVTERKAS